MFRCLLITKPTQRKTDPDHTNTSLLALIPISNLNREQLQFNLLQFFCEMVKSNSSLSMTMVLISDELDVAFLRRF